MKPNKEKIITEILISLEKGMNFTDCFKLIQTNSNLVRSTFASYWKKANERYLASQQDIQRTLAEQSKQAEVDRLKKAILNKDDALEILTAIANEQLKIGAAGEVSAKTEQISAIKTIAELQGWNAPTEINTQIEVVKKLRIGYKKNEELE